MKKIYLLIIVLSIFNLTNAQEWKVHNGKVFWEMIVDESITDADAKQIAVNFPGEFILELEDKIVYQIKLAQLPYQEYGGKGLTTPFFARDPFDARMTIYIREDQYKIELTEFVMMNPVQQFPFETYLLRKNELHPNKKISLWRDHFTDFLIKSFETRSW